MLHNFVTISDVHQGWIGFATPLLSKCSRMHPVPPSPRVPMLPLVAHLVVCCSGMRRAALLVLAAFASFIWHQHAHQGQLRQLDS